MLKIYGTEYSVLARVGNRGHGAEKKVTDVVYGAAECRISDILRSVVRINWLQHGPHKRGTCKWRFCPTLCVTAQLYACRETNTQYYNHRGSFSFFKIKLKDFQGPSEAYSRGLHITITVVLSHFSKSNWRTFKDHPRHIHEDYINPKWHFHKHI